MTSLAIFISIITIFIDVSILFCTDFSMVAIIVEKTKKSIDESSAENEPAARATTAKACTRSHIKQALRLKCNVLVHSNRKKNEKTGLL